MSSDRLAALVAIVMAGCIAILLAILLLVPTVHHVGDTRYCTGTGTGVNLNGGGVSVVTVLVPCGVYREGDPDVTR